MDTREKLIELFRGAVHFHDEQNEKWIIGGKQGERPNIFNSQADHLIANGVTVQELDGCIRCKDSQQMTVTISNKLVDGVNTGWFGGNLPARFCPFCGRRLPQQPKIETIYCKLKQPAEVKENA